MAEDDEFRIKGAASRSSISEQSSSGSHDHGGVSAENSSGQAEDAEQAQRKDGSRKGEENGDEAKETQKAVEDMTIEEKRQKYKWYKCKAEGSEFPEGSYYYIHYDTQQTTWEEPQESYWLWDAVQQGPNMIAGLISPSTLSESSKPAASEEPEEYHGYNPKIHGNYDPNADYAKYHEQKRQNEAYVADAQAVTQATAKTDYSSTMALNRFTGKAQTGDLGPERHSDSAKSSRQMNAFFDVDAAANAHQGRSLKEERRNQKISKAKAKEYNAARKEKKDKKRKAWLAN